MDERYKRGKIYTIRCRYDDTLIYVGSTIDKYLSSRMAKHRHHRLNCLYQYVNGDWDNWYIELYENYPCNSKQELEKREGEIIRQIGTINKRIEGRTNKEYIQDNRDKISEYQKKHYQDNKEKITEYHKKRNKEKINCENCGSNILKCGLSRHKKSSKCLNYNVGIN